MDMPIGRSYHSSSRDGISVARSYEPSRISEAMYGPRRTSDQETPRLSRDSIKYHNDRDRQPLHTNRYEPAHAPRDSVMGPPRHDNYITNQEHGRGQQGVRFADTTRTTSSSDRRPQISNDRRRDSARDDDTGSEFSGTRTNRREDPPRSHRDQTSRNEDRNRSETQTAQRMRDTGRTSLHSVNEYDENTSRDREAIARGKQPADNRYAPTRRDSGNAGRGLDRSNSGRYRDHDDYPSDPDARDTRARDPRDSKKSGRGGDSRKQGSRTYDEPRDDDGSGSEIAGIYGAREGNQRNRRDSDAQRDQSSRQSTLPSRPKDSRPVEGHRSERDNERYSANRSADSRDLQRSRTHPDGRDARTSGRYDDEPPLQRSNTTSRDQTGDRTRGTQQSRQDTDGWLPWETTAGGNVVRKLRYRGQTVLLQVRSEGGSRYIDSNKQSIDAQKAAAVIARVVGGSQEAHRSSQSSGSSRMPQTSTGDRDRRREGEREPVRRRESDAARASGREPDDRRSARADEDGEGRPARGLMLRRISGNPRRGPGDDDEEDFESGSLNGRQVRTRVQRDRYAHEPEEEEDDDPLGGSFNGNRAR
jgi:hypothetical protein